MKAQFLKLAGVKSEKEFYQKYPTEAAFFEAHPEAQMMMRDGGNVPTNPALWSRAKAAAKAKYDVYPSAYANGFAAKWYKGKGGGWKKAEYGMEVMAKGGTNNPGFKALPDFVQHQILSNMAMGGVPCLECGGSYAKGGQTDPDGEMAMGQIDAMINRLSNLKKFITPESDLEPWISDKLSVMNHSATAVDDYYSNNPEAQMEIEGLPMEQMKNGGIPSRYKNMGFSKVGQKKDSSRPGKKWMVLAKKGDDYKVVHGGYDGMKDYTQHGSEKRRDNFWNRMGGKNSAKANDPFSPLYWHKRLGTWEDGGTFSGNTYYQNGGLVRGGNLKTQAYQKMLNQKYGAGLKEDGAWGSETQNAYEKFVANANSSSEKKVVNPVVKTDNKKLNEEIEYNKVAKSNTMWSDNELDQLSQPSILNQVTQAVLPTRLGHLVRGAAGIDNVTSNFSDGMLQAMGSAINKAKKQGMKPGRPGMDGSFGYDQYPGGRKAINNISKSGNDILNFSTDQLSAIPYHFKNLAGTLFNDPVGDLETTVGAADFKQLPNGDYFMYDDYNFDQHNKNPDNVIEYMEVVGDKLGINGRTGAIIPEKYVDSKAAADRSKKFNAKNLKNIKTGNYNVATFNLPGTQMFQTGGLVRGGNKNVQSYQQMLNEKYGANLAEDGAWGKKTQAAYEKFILNKKSAGSSNQNDQVTLTTTRAPEAGLPNKANPKPKKYSGLVDIKKEFGLEPLSKLGIEKAMEIAKTNPNVKFKCDADGCSQIASDAASAYGKGFNRTHAWWMGNENKVEKTFDNYATQLENLTGPLSDPTNYLTNAQQLVNYPGRVVGLNRTNNRVANPEGVVANDSFEYGNPRLYKNTRGYEHVGYMLNPQTMLHGTGASNGHSAFYVIDNVNDGINLNGYGKYDPVEVIKGKSQKPKDIKKNKVQAAAEEPSLVDQLVNLFRRNGGELKEYNTGGFPEFPAVPMGDPDAPVDVVQDIVPNTQDDFARQKQEMERVMEYSTTELSNNQAAKLRNDIKNINAAADAKKTKPTGLDMYMKQNAMFDLGNSGMNMFSQSNKDKAQRDYLRSQQMTDNLVPTMSGNATGTQGNYAVTGSGYGMFRPDQMGVKSPDGMYQGKFYQEGGIIPDALENVTMQAPDLPEIPMMETPEPLAPEPVAEAAPVKKSAGFAEIKDIKDYIISKESGGNYAALPKKKDGSLASSAVGAYQFLWNQHKSWISDVTGVKSKEEFRNNPNAQDKAWEYWNKSVLTPNAKTLQQKYAPDVPLNNIKALIHFQGPTGAERYLRTGQGTTDAFGTTAASYTGIGRGMADLKTKPGVNVNNLDPGLLSFASTMSSIFPGLTISSGNDSKHMKGSKHYGNKALDFGANSSNRTAYNRFKKELFNNPSLKQQYGIEDIIDEGDHIHVEMMQAGGEYELTKEQIDQILAAGGQIELL